MAYRWTCLMNLVMKTIEKHKEVIRLKTIWLGLVGFVFMLMGCQTPFRLAERYIAELPPIKAAVYFPEKAEVKVEYNTQYAKQTEVLTGFSHDLFLDVMYNAYAEMMGDYGVEVYVPDNIENVPVDSVNWLVMLSRMEISGRITEYEDFLFSDTDEFSYKHPLNTVNVASWFEINDGEWQPVLFCEHNLIDGFTSHTDFSFWTQKIDYTYNIDTLELKDVYNYAVYLGKLYAGYTYDYMINDYVTSRLNQHNISYRVRMRYDPYKKRVRIAEEGDGFVVIE